MTELHKHIGACAEFFAPSGNKYPFSEAVRVGDTVYLAGQIGLGPDGLVKGFDAQIRQMMENVKATLNKLGLGMEHLVKCTVFMKDMAQWQAFNAVYTTYFDSTLLPARSAFGAVTLAFDAHAEIECIACFPPAKLPGQAGGASAVR